MVAMVSDKDSSTWQYKRKQMKTDMHEQGQA